MLAKVLQSEFVANVGKVFAGNGIGFVATFLAIPVISRLYLPDDYGVIGLFVSVAAVATVLATLKYEMAIVLPKDDGEAARLLRAALKMAALLALTVLFAVATLRSCCASLPSIATLLPILWWLPLVVFLMAMTKLLLNGWLTRQKAFGRLATAELSNTLINLGVRIGLGVVVGSTVWGLMAGLLLGLLAGLTVAWSLSRRALRFDEPLSDFGALKAYPEFPAFTMPADFVRTFAQNLPVIFFGFMFSPAIAGLFYMANRLIKAPVELGLHAFRGVYLQKVSAMHNAGQPLKPTYLRTVGIMFLLGVVPALVLFTFGAEILTFVLGEAWSEAGRFAEVLSPLLLSFWVSSPAAMLLITLRKQNYWLAVQLAIAVCQVLVFVVALVAGKSALWTLTWFVTVQVLINLGLKVLVLQLLPSPGAKA